MVDVVPAAQVCLAFRVLAPYSSENRLLGPVARRVVPVTAVENLVKHCTSFAPNVSNTISCRTVSVIIAKRSTYKTTIRNVLEEVSVSRFSLSHACHL